MARAKLPTEEDTPGLSSKELKSLTSKIETAKSPGERDYLQGYLLLYRRQRALVKKAYTECMESKGGRGYYGYCALVSSLREIIADIRVLDDVDQHSTVLKTQILQTFTTSVAQTLINSSFHLRQLVSETSERGQRRFAQETVEKVFTDIASELQRAYEDACNSVDASFTSVADPHPPRRKSK